MRICIVASSRFPIREPFAGGLEAMTHTMARELAARGHEVTLFAGPGSDASLPVRLRRLDTFEPSEAALADRFAPSREWLAEHHAYLGLMLDLARSGHDEFDVIHNNSLHHLPVAMSAAVAVPMITTLHTPPLPFLESALALDGHSSTFVAVSEWTSRSWRHVLPSTVIHNGLDLSAWPVGQGGGPVVWSGRLVPEKGAHEAIEACRLAGLPLVLVGPRQDPRYFHEVIEPMLGDDVQYADHLHQRHVARLLRTACAALVTPLWDEPYGLVAAEAMACGTPVAGYARGGLPEVVGHDGGVLVPPGDVAALGEALHRAVGLDRAAVRRRAETTCSSDRMIDAYERLYADTVQAVRAA